MAYTVRVLEPSILVRKQPNTLSSDIFLAAIRELDSECEKFVVYGQDLARHCPHIIWQFPDEATARILFNLCNRGLLPIGYSITTEDFLFMLLLVIQSPFAKIQEIPKAYTLDGSEDDTDKALFVSEISHEEHDLAKQGKSWMGYLQ
ncbi:MAG: hypothetical protein AAB552_01300 [Patescibacteria group bacterium]